MHALRAPGSLQSLCEQAWAWGTHAIPGNQPRENQPLDIQVKTPQMSETPVRLLQTHEPAQTRSDEPGFHLVRIITNKK